MKLSQETCPNDTLGEFENGSGWLKKFSLYGYSYNTRCQIYFLIFIKLGQKICPNDIFYKFKMLPVCNKIWPPGGEEFIFILLYIPEVSV